jgi:Zn-dependent M28 family amino/carboxypeptidase
MSYGKPPLPARLAIFGAVLLVLVGLPVGVLLWMTAVPGRSWAGPLPPLGPGEARLAGRLHADVAAIGSEPHNASHAEALERSAAYIERRLAGLGYAVRRQSFAVGGTSVRNIEAMVEPARSAPSLVVGAHYDSAGGAPGANDNATGVAALLEIARALRPLDGRARLRVRLVFFVNEEPPFFKTPLMGSLVYAKALKRRGEPVAGMIALETLGFYSDAAGSQHYPPLLAAFYPDRGNFVAFVGTTGARGWVRRTVRDFRAVARVPSEGGTAPALLQGIDWSDHWAFGQAGVPALMVTDTAPFRYPYYHSPADTPDRVDYSRLARVAAALDRMVLRWGETGL